VAEALARLLTDEALRARMGAAGRARALRDFTAERYVHGVMDVYGALDLIGGTTDGF
jgi:glycosyltransferase involved in cell wall biosynthesis